MTGYVAIMGVKSVALLIPNAAGVHLTVFVTYGHRLLLVEQAIYRLFRAQAYALH